ncbi:MAG: RdgB/HAM1 family non-canonical purine NTP pyrophosphatase [Acidobacteria bacterium]|nr:RdgB/HAM1 family non-canonical purine NTP pyrophosphatase [Acidobacteriota bacterium]
MTASRELVCATANPGKVAEIAGLLPDGWVLLPRPQSVGEIVEDAGTLVGNARLKARAILAVTGKAAVADDTGLEVAALGDAPGVDTAIYAGEGCTDADNRRKLLGALSGAAERAARFVTVVLVAWPDGRETIVEGVCNGRIAAAERGDRGFGFDPLFIPDDGDGRTFAEMTAEEKNLLSHRGRAFRALAAALTESPTA